MNDATQREGALSRMRKFRENIEAVIDETDCDWQGVASVLMGALANVLAETLTEEAAVAAAEKMAGWLPQRVRDAVSVIEAAEDVQ